jgi:hypothetical protein
LKSTLPRLSLALTLCMTAGALASALAFTPAPAPEAAASEASAPAPAAVPADLDLKQLIESRSNSLVTIKFILKSPDGEQESEATGTLISGEGLVLTSNFAMGGSPFGGSATPTQLKVLVGEDTQGVDATFIARDTELGLAWVKVDKAPEKPYSFVDMNDSAGAALGDHLYTVQKLGKFFGVAYSVAEGRVGATVSKPRNLILPTIGLAGGEIAVPAFSSSGKVVGVSALILPDMEEMENARQNMRGAELGMILPAKDVAEATTKALENAASGVVEEPAPSSEPTPGAAAGGEPEKK